MATPRGVATHRLGTADLDSSSGSKPVFTLVCMSLADHCPLKNPEIVERSQEQLLACLGYLFHKFHPEERMRFPRIVNCLLQMRSMRMEHVKAEERFANDWLGVVKIPPLLCEMWSF